MLRRLRDWYRAAAAQAEATNVWPTYGRRRRLLVCAVLAVEFAGVLWVCARGLSRMEPDPAARWLILLWVASLVSFMLLQFAFWPRGAGIRIFKLIPWWLLALVVGFAVFVR